MNIEFEETKNNNDTEVERYLRWIKSLKPKKSRDYMNLWHSYINDEPLKTVYQMDKEPYKYGNSLPPIITKLPSFMNTQMLLYELNKLRHKSFKFNGDAIEEEPTHPWDDDNLYNKLIQSKASNTAPTSRVIFIDSCDLLKKQTEWHDNVVKSTLKTISEITNDPNPDPDDPVNDYIIRCKLATVSKNKRKYLVEELERIRNSAVLEDFKNKEFLGEYPHEQ